MHVMIPTNFGRPAKLSEVKGPAMVLPVSERGELFLVTATEPSMALFFSGSHINHAMPIEGSGNWTGLAIEGVEVEFDLASIYSLEFSSLTLGSLVREGAALGILAKVRDSHGFYSTEVVSLSANLPEGSEGLRVGFYRWRVIIRENDEKHVLQSFDVTPST